jgi:hypothetical protein
MRTSETSVVSLPYPRRYRLAIRRRLLLPLSFALLFGLTLLGSSAIPASTQAWIGLNAVSSIWNWDFVGWELVNLALKARAQVAQPAARLDAAASAALVRSYLDRAQAIGKAERDLDELFAQPAAGEQRRFSAADLAKRQRLETRLEILREQQALVRPAVEQTIEGQVSAVVAQQQIGAGFKAFPPVWFTFSEPPRKLVVSTRDQIATTYYAMLQPGLPADDREQIESTILDKYNQSAYITSIGGLGAYPTIVVAQAPLPWVLSTVAHEWIHNYLTFFPLGLNYTTTSELTIINETVADIAGDELGAKVLTTYYPELERDFPGKDQSAHLWRSEDRWETFDYSKEMRHTREVVDLFLKYGRVEDAEEYMQIRRLLFEENGYPIRKLNQAYFAFHGSYGTGAAATSPIGPKLEQLRELSPDLRTFLETVRWFTSEADLDKALVSASASSGSTESGSFDSLD